VLVRLGADLNRVRQQVIQLLHGYQGKEPAAARSGPVASTEPRRDRMQLGDVLRRVGSMESRLSAIESRVGTGPDAADLDGLITGIRRDKEAAIEAQDFEHAAALRDKEKELLASKASRQEGWAAAHPDLPSLAEEVHRLREEVGRLSALLDAGGEDSQSSAS
jgi:hypothetical protein